MAPQLPVLAGYGVFIVSFLTLGSPIAKTLMIVVLLIAAWIAQQRGACQDSHVLAIFAAVGVWSQVAPLLMMDERVTSSLYWVSAAAAVLIAFVALRKRSSRDFVLVSAMGALICTHGFWR